MRTFARRTAEDRRVFCDETAARLGLPAVAIEKDFWVCWTLRELGDLPGIGPRLTFKGGTSLSKAWNLIARFSEDIDLVVDRETFGFVGERSPETAGLSAAQRNRRIKELRSRCRKWVQGAFTTALSARLASSLGEGSYKLYVDPDTLDGQCLIFEYPVAVPSNHAYLTQRVKIELGARGDGEPFEHREVRPYVAAEFPAIVTDGTFSFRTLDPERTFWEKGLLLHEHTFRPPDKRPARNMARHYYDLYRLITVDGGRIASAAAANQALFVRTIRHRSIYFNDPAVDYADIRRGTLRLRPSDTHRDHWRRDYEDMRAVMLFEPSEAPSFDEILATVATFEADFNASA